MSSRSARVSRGGSGWAVAGAAAAGAAGAAGAVGAVGSVGGGSSPSPSDSILAWLFALNFCQKDSPPLSGPKMLNKVAVASSSFRLKWAMSLAWFAQLISKSKGCSAGFAALLALLFAGFFAGSLLGAGGALALADRAASAFSRLADRAASSSSRFIFFRILLVGGVHGAGSAGGAEVAAGRWEAAEHKAGSGAAGAEAAALLPPSACADFLALLGLGGSTSSTGGTVCSLWCSAKAACNFWSWANLLRAAMVTKRWAGSEKSTYDPKRFRATIPGFSCLFSCVFVAYFFVDFRVFP